MPAARAKQRFVTALVQEDEPVEQRRCSEALSGGPGRGPRPKRKPDAGCRQCNADKDESGAAGVLRLKMPELSWNRWPVVVVRSHDGVAHRHDTGAPVGES